MPSLLSDIWYGKRNARLEREAQELEKAKDLVRFKSLLEAVGETEKRRAALADQRQGQLDIPQQPLDPADVVSLITETRRGIGQPMTPEQTATLAGATARQGDVGMRQPVTARPSLLSYAPSTALLTPTDAAAFEEKVQTSPIAKRRDQRTVSGGLRSFVPGLPPDVADLMGRSKEGMSALGTAVTERVKPPPSKTFGDEATLLSHELFGGRDPGQLTPPEVGRLNREVQQRAIARERERGSEAARIQIQGSLDRPIAAKERRSYLDPETFQPIPATVKTERDLLEVGAIYADPKQREDLNSLNESSTILASLDGLTQSIITATNPAEAGLQKVMLEAGAATKQNEVAASYKDTLQTFLTKFGRQLGGDTGVFTNQDLARILNGMPGFGDTAAIRDYKIGLFRLMIETGQDAKRKTILGLPYDKAATRARVEALIEGLEGVNPEANVPTPDEDIDRRIQDLEEKARQ